MKIIYAIVVVYNGMQRNWIQKCLSSLENSSVPVNIVAIDNASTDESVKFINKNFPNVHLLKSAENLGFGKANNMGIKIAVRHNADYVFLLNQDAWIENDTIQNLVYYSTRNEEYGVISPLHLNGNGDALDISFSKSVAPSFCPDLYSDFVLRKEITRIYRAEFICAAAWLISKRCLKTVGGFSPTFYHYAEDDNYVHRLHFHKLKIGVLPIARIYHDRESRPESTTFDASFYKERNQYILEISNPNTNLRTNDILKHLSVLKIKTLFSKNKTAIKKLQKLKIFLKNNEKQFDLNLEKSKNGNYQFLQID